ncbi:MAG: cation:proton antiporter [Methanocellales archaeon]
MVDILEIGLAFLIIAIGGYIAYYARQSVVPAFILVGMLFGPYGLKIISSSEIIIFIAEIGVIVLLLFLGLEFSLKRLLGAKKSLKIAGLLDLAINFTFGLILGLLLNFTLLESLFLGGIVYMSSSGIVTKALIDLKRIIYPETDIILAIMVFEDIFIAIFLAFISGIAIAGGEKFLVLISIFKAVAFCLIFLLVAKKYNHIVDRIIDIRSDELFLIFLFGLVIVVSAIAQRIGVSEAIGAFFLGLAFSETKHVERIEKKIVPLRDLFACMFFFAFGMMIDISTFVGIIGIAAVFIPAIVCSKIASGYFSARVLRFEKKQALFIGYGSIPRGEFSIILASLAIASGLNYSLYPLTVMIVLTTSILGILLMSKSDSIYQVIFSN